MNSDDLMSTEQQQKVLAWIQEHRPTCPVCGFEGTQVQQSVQTALVMKHPGQPNMGPNLTGGLLLVSAVCKRCGNVTFFEAERVGVI